MVSYLELSGLKRDLVVNQVLIDKGNFCAFFALVLSMEHGSEIDPSARHFANPTIFDCFVNKRKVENFGNF